MTHHYPDLNSDFDWLKHIFSQLLLKKQYPDLGSEVSSVWNLCTDGMFSQAMWKNNKKARKEKLNSYNCIYKYTSITN